jgi:uncharacterized protein YndB with AHSA1/START domain
MSTDTEVDTSLKQERKVMTNHVVIHDTFVLERSFPKSPERVFVALSDPAKRQRWYGAGLSENLSYELDFRTGGAERATWRMSDKTPFPGATLANEGIHLDIVPNQRVIIGSTMSLGGRHMSASLCTFELVATATGTDLIFTHQGAFLENSDGPEMRKGGWNALLDQFVKEVAAS